jgi:DNA-binding NarL/FixJ family response regulator
MRDVCVSKIRVLLADDNKDMLEYVRGVLSAGRYEVVGTANDGQAAVEAAAQLLPDLAVLDVSMPILNGIQAAARLKKTHPAIKIVFLTVDRDPDTCQAALDAGALGYVFKPRLGRDLFTAIEYAHEGRRFISDGCG